VDTPVAYACSSPSHQVGDGGGPDKLTVHDGKWAYCLYDARADGHEWTPTGGVTFTMLRQRAALRATVVKERKGAG